MVRAPSWRFLLVTTTTNRLVTHNGNILHKMYASTVYKDHFKLTPTDESL